jgi:hypothetical protein
MTTIYEIFEERRKLLREKYFYLGEVKVTPYNAEDTEVAKIVEELYGNTLKKSEEDLRQSFIAMVEGQLAYWQGEVSKRGVIGYQIIIQDQISRLESELIRLKEN